MKSFMQFCIRTVLVFSVRQRRKGNIMIAVALSRKDVPCFYDWSWPGGRGQDAVAMPQSERLELACGISLEASAEREWGRRRRAWLLMSVITEKNITGLLKLRPRHRKLC
ncbi:hypothetical protein M758_11G121200 [Ceratodon purpureus]|nr:hypothetical protein M758_11G121200 [Ceratodon purpureus]